MMPRLLIPALALSVSSVRITAADSGVSLAKSVPDGAIAYAEISGLGELVRTIQHSDALEWALATDEYKKFEKSEEFRNARTFRAAAELMLGSSLWDVTAELLSGRAALAVYPDSGSSGMPRGIAVARFEETKTLGRVRDALKPLLSAAGKETDTTSLCPGSITWDLKGQGFVSLRDTWIIATRERPLLEATLSLIAGSTDAGKALAARENFAAMTAALHDNHHLLAWADTPLIAKSMGPRFGLPPKFDDGMASLLFGGLVELAGHSRFAAATLDVKPGGLDGQLAISGDPSKLPEPDRLWFNQPPDNGTIAIPELPGTIAGMTVHRKIGEWYRHRDAILSDRLLPAFDKFETDIGNLLPQKDFGQDVLPLLGDNFTLTAALQSFDHLGGQPGIKLPAFAIILDMANPDAGSDTFQLFFQTLATILNLQAGQEGRQPSVMDTELHNGTKITWSRFLAKPTGDRLPIAWNFQPAAAAVGRKYIIATSVKYCRDLVDHLLKPESTRWQNHCSEMKLDPAALAKLAELNEGLLRSQEIQKGTAPESAARRIELLIRALTKLKSVHYQSAVENGLLRLHLNAAWK